MTASPRRVVPNDQRPLAPGPGGAGRAWRPAPAAPDGADLAQPANRATAPGRRGGGGPGRRPGVRARARGTVNDVVLATVAGALRDMLAARGEQLREVTISVLVSARSGTSGGELGNQVGVMPVTAPTDGDLGERVTRIAAITRKRKSRARGSSAAVLVPAFLLLAAWCSRARRARA